jgi:uncharacterized cupin superfamily protein
MAQQNITDYPIDPTTTTGSDLADRLNRTHNAEASQHSGAARPGYLIAGGIWTKTAAAGSYALMWFDGTTDHEICKIVSGAITVGSGGGGGSAVIVQDTPPTVKEGSQWYESDTGKMYFGYKNPTGGALSWVEVSNRPATP